MESIEDWVKNNCQAYCNGGDHAVKILPNNDTFGYVPAEWVRCAVTELRNKSLTGLITDADRLLAELLRNSLK